MGVGIREMKLSWREGPRCGGLETCHGKKQGATEGLVVGFPNYGFSHGQWGQQGCLLWLLVEGKKETHFTLSILPLTSFCRSENENTERLSNMSTVTQLGSGRTRETSSTSHL